MKDYVWLEAVGQGPMLFRRDNILRVIKDGHLSCVILSEKMESGENAFITVKETPNDLERILNREA